MITRKKMYFLLFALLLSPVSIIATSYLASIVSFFLSPLSIYDIFEAYKIFLYCPLYLFFIICVLSVLIYWFISCYHILWGIYILFITGVLLGGPGVFGLILFNIRIPGVG